MKLIRVKCKDDLVVRKNHNGDVSLEAVNKQLRSLSEGDKIVFLTDSGNNMGSIVYNYAKKFLEVRSWLLSGNKISVNGKIS